MTVPDGQSFIILTSPDRSLQGLSPFRIKRELDTLIGPVVTAKVVRSGSLLIRVKNKAQASLALSIQTFLGNEVAASPATKLNSVAGTVFAPSLKNMDETELLHELRPQGVTLVTRLRSRGPTPNPRIKIHFLGLTCPPAIYAGYEILEVREWEPSPRLCRQCGSFGHNQTTCRSKRLNCLKCGTSGHKVDECDRDLYRCGHCGGPHPAWDRMCPAWEYQKNKLRAKLAPPPPPPPFPPSSYSESGASEYPALSSSPRRASLTDTVPSRENPPVQSRTPKAPVRRQLSAPEAVETPASEPERVTESPLSPDGKQTETSAGPPAVTPGQAQCDRGDDESVPNSTGNMVMESWVDSIVDTGADSDVSDTETVSTIVGPVASPPADLETDEAAPAASQHVNADTQHPRATTRAPSPTPSEGMKTRAAAAAAREKSV